MSTPTRFSELVGQDDAVQHLERLADHGRLPHAMMFVGPESVGKFTAARLVAKGLLCQGTKARPLDACGVCPACVKVDGGNHADLHAVVTEERQIKIQSIRAVEQALRLRPVEGELKLLVIDDAHRMNVQTQNALLKTLEEPPGQTHIIHTTPRLRNILPTVVSRCQRVAFRALAGDVVVDTLVRVRGLDRAQAHLLASLAGGSVGRALLLEADDIFALRDVVADLDRTLEPRTARGALIAMSKAASLVEDRALFAEAIQLLQVWLQDQMRLAADPELEVANVDRRPQLQALAEQRGLQAVLGRLRAVNETRRQLEMPYNFNPQLLAEQLCLDLAGHGRVEISNRDY